MPNSSMSIGRDIIKLSGWEVKALRCSEGVDRVGKVEVVHGKQYNPSQIKVAS